jgi:hypothetical protein
MTITFENDNDVMVYTLEKIILYARRTQQIFVAQCVWWLASIIGLEQGLIIFIDNLQSRDEVTVVPAEVPDLSEMVPKSLNDDRQDRVLKDCEEFLWDS